MRAPYLSVRWLGSVLVFYALVLSVASPTKSQTAISTCQCWLSDRGRPASGVYDRPLQTVGYGDSRHGAQLDAAITNSGLWVSSSVFTAQSSGDRCGTARAHFRDMQKHVDDLQLQVRQDEQAVRNLGFAKREQDFTEWENTLEANKQELRKATLDAMLTSAFLNFEKAIKVAGSLNPVTANRMIRELQGSGYDFAPLIASIRRLARVRSKPAYRTAALNILGVLEKTKDAAILDYDSGLRTTMLEALAKALSYGLKDPRVALTVAGIENFVSLVYSEAAKDVSREQIDRLTQLTEVDLRSLERISDLMRVHIRQLNESRQQTSDANKQLSNCLSENDMADCEGKCDKTMSNCMDRALKSPSPFQALAIETECMRANNNCKQGCRNRAPK